MKKFPYKTSKDFFVLKKLLDNGINVITVIKRRNRRNLSFTAYSYVSDVTNTVVYVMGRSKSEDLITIANRDLKDHTFEELCSLYAIEFIKP